MSLLHNRVVRLLSCIVAPAVATVMFVASCASISTPENLTAAPGESNDRAPRLIKREFGVVWDSPDLFGSVPAELQLAGDQACNLGRSQRMKATGYHARAVRLDGTAFPKGGFLCAEDLSLAMVSETTGLAAPTPVANAFSEMSAAEPDARTKAWAKAWASKDLVGYFSFYSSGFKPGGFANLDAWREARAARISRPGVLSIDISNLSVKVITGDVMETTFTQRYASSSLKETSIKTLLWVNEGGQWKIISESNR